MTLPANLPPFLTIEEFRRLTNTSRGHAYRLVRERALPAVRLGKRGAIRIPRSSLADFLASRLVGDEVEEPPS